MPLATEAIEGGLFTVSDATRRFFLDWRADLYNKDFTPMENRPGAAEAIEEMKSLFADGFSCQEFKDKLYALGAFGCSRSRRLKAIAAMLGLTDKEVEDCLAEPRKDPGPQVYYLPPEDSLIAKIGLRDVPEPEDDVSSCAAPATIHAAEDALCATDSGRGCDEPDGEDTEDMDETDCDAAADMLSAISDLFPVIPPAGLIDRPTTRPTIIEASTSTPTDKEPQAPEEEESVGPRIAPPLSTAFPLYSSRTYLDALYAAINIHDHPKFRGCENVQADAAQLIERINREIIKLPEGYVNPDLLPRGFDYPNITVKPPPIKQWAGLSDAAGRRARQAAASARRATARRIGI